MESLSFPPSLSPSTLIQRNCLGPIKEHQEDTKSSQGVHQDKDEDR